MCSAGGRGAEPGSGALTLGRGERYPLALRRTRVGALSPFPSQVDYEAHLSAEPHPAPSRTWVPKAHEDTRRTDGAQAAALQGAPAHRRIDILEVSMGQKTGRFTRTDRLRRLREFQAVASQGKRAASQSFVALAALRQSATDNSVGVRLGITVSRKVGGSVVRNRLKRRVREWFRSARGRLPQGLDLVVIARRPAAELDGQQLDAALSELVLCLGLSQ